MQERMEIKDINFNSELTGIIENSVYISILTFLSNSLPDNHLIGINAHNGYLGMFLFFLIPLINLIFRNYKALIGNIFGIFVVFFLGTILFPPYAK